jgi:hypothetical protein
MEAEIALPLDAALEAIDFFEQEGWEALGLEGVFRRADGRIGHPSAVLATGAMPEDRDEAYAFVRESVVAEARARARRPGVADAELLFCLTFEPPAGASAD